MSAKNVSFKETKENKAFALQSVGKTQDVTKREQFEVKES